MSLDFQQNNVQSSLFYEIKRTHYFSLSQAVLVAGNEAQEDSLVKATPLFVSLLKHPSLR